MTKKDIREFIRTHMPSRWTRPPRDPARIDEMLELLGKLWKRHPDLRLGQLIVSLVNPSGPCSEVFNREDDKLREAILNRMSEPESTRKPSGDDQP